MCLLALVATAMASSSRTLASGSKTVMMQRRMAFLGGYGLVPTTATKVVPTATAFSSALRPSPLIMFEEIPRRTRENEPDEYFQTNLDKVPVKERFGDPILILILAGILLPFVAVGIIIQSGVLTQ